MSDDYITLIFSVRSPIDFAVGDYADVGGENADGTAHEFGRFEIVDSQQKPTFNTSTGGYDYELKMEAQYCKWKNKLHKFQPQVGGQECTWSLTATADVHAQQILHSLNTLAYGADVSSTFLLKSTTLANDDTVVESTATQESDATQPLYLYNGSTRYRVVVQKNVDASAKTITYTNAYIFDACAAIAETFECEWWVEGNTIYFGECEDSATTTPIVWESGYELENISPRRSTEGIATRIIAFGSTKNISSRYRKDLIFTVTDKDGNAFFDSERQLRASYFNTEAKLGYNSEGNVIAIGTTFTASLKKKTSIVQTTFTINEVSLGTLAAGKYNFYFGKCKPQIVCDGDADTIAAGEFTFTVSGYTSATKKELATYQINAQFVHTRNAQDITEEEYTKALSTLYVEAAKLYSATIKCELRVTYEMPYNDCNLTCSIEDASFDVTYTDASEVTNVRVTNIRTGKELICTFVDGKFVLTDGTADIVVGDTFTVNKEDLLYGFVPASFFSSRLGEESSNIIKNGVVETHLMLPESGKPYVDLYEGMSEQEAIEDVVIFEDIYPKSTDYVREIRQVTRTYQQDEENGEQTTKTYTAYQIRGDLFTQRTWSNSYIIEGKTLSVTFGDGEKYKEGDTRADGSTIKEGDAEIGKYINSNSGKLNGWSFDVEVKRLPKDESNPTGEMAIFFELSRLSNSNVPNEFICPQLHDEFVLTNFDISCVDEVLVEQAEKELEQTAKLYVQKLNVDANTYDCDVMSDFATKKSEWRTLSEKSDNLAIGTRQNIYIDATELTFKNNVTRNIYDVQGFAQGDSCTLTAVIEVSGIDFSADNAQLQLQTDETYGYRVLSQVIKANGLYYAEKSGTIGGTATLDDTGHIQLRCDYLKAIDGECACIRVSNVKYEKSAQASAYSPSLSEVELIEDSVINAHLGQQIRLTNCGYFKNGVPYRDSRIIGYQMQLDLPYDTPIYTVGDKVRYTRFGEISDNITALNYALKTLKEQQAQQISQSSSTATTSNSVTVIGGTTASTFTVLTTSDILAITSDSNVFSSARTLAEIAKGEVASAKEAEHAAKADSADKATTAATATHADNATLWANNAYSDVIDQSVRTTDDVTFNSVAVTDGVTASSVSANTANFSTTTSEEIKSSNFTAEEVGSGFGIVNESGKTHLYVDKVTAREQLSVTRLQISEIRSVGGTIVISQGSGEVESAKLYTRQNKVYGYRVTLKKECQFQVGDFVRWGESHYNADSETLTQRSGWFEVTAISGLVLSLSNAVVITDGAENLPQEGDALVLFGSKNEGRDGFVLVTSDEKGENIRMYHGVNTTSYDFTNAALALGRLDSITDEDFSDMSGWGLYAQSAYLKGVLKVLNNGKYQSVTDYISTQIEATNGKIALCVLQESYDADKEQSDKRITLLEETTDGLTTTVSEVKQNTSNPNLLVSTANITDSFYTYFSKESVDASAQADTVTLKRKSDDSVSTEEYLCIALSKDLLQKGVKYTLSFDVYIESMKSESSYLTTGICDTDAKNSIVPYEDVRTIESDYTTRYTRTFTPTANSLDSTHVCINFGRHAQGEWRRIKVSKIKIEKGDTATAWSASADDFTSAITQINQQAQSITLQAQNITKAQESADAAAKSAETANTTATDAATSASTANTTANQNKEDIAALTVRADSITSRVEDAEGNISQLEQTADSISAKLKTYDSIVDNLFEQPYFDCPIASNGYFRKDNKDTLLTAPIAQGNPMGIHLCGKFGTNVINIYYGDGWAHTITLYGSKSKQVLNGTRKADYKGGIEGEVVEFYTTSDDDASTDANKSVFVVYTNDEGSVINDTCYLTHVIVAQTDNIGIGTLLKGTGIDVTKGEVTVTADNFRVQNNSGEQTAMVDASGKLSTSLIDADALTVKNIAVGTKVSGYGTLITSDGRINAQLIDIITLIVQKVIATNGSQVLSTINYNGDGAIQNYYDGDVTKPALRICTDSTGKCLLQILRPSGAEACHIGINGLIMAGDDDVSIRYEKREIVKLDSDKQAQVYDYFTDDSRAVDAYIYRSSDETDELNNVWFTDEGNTRLGVGTYYDRVPFADPSAMADNTITYFRKKYVISPSGVLKESGTISFTVELS
jgi:hypothetical protein